MAKEPEYGETTATREQVANAPLPQEPPPEQPEEMAQEAAEAIQETPTEATPPAEPQAEVTQPEGFTVRNRYMLLPPSVNFNRNQQKPAANRKQDAGLLFQILAKKSPIFDFLVKEMTGE